MYKVKKIVSCFILCALIFSLCACGKDRGIGSTDNDVYEETIGGLEDNELFAMIDTNAPLPVLRSFPHAHNEKMSAQKIKHETIFLTLYIFSVSFFSVFNHITYEQYQSDRACNHGWYH